MVQNELGYKIYPGRGDTGPYAIDFEVARDDSGNAKDIKVYYEDAAGNPPVDITSTSTVTGLNAYTAASYPAADSVVLLRRPSLKQLSAYADGAVFPGTATERDFDRIYYLLQYFDYAIARYLMVRVTDTDPVWLPSKSARPGKVLAFDGEGLPYGACGIPTVYASAWAATFLDDLTLLAGQKTLGLIPVGAGAVISAFIQGLLDDADAAASRATLSVYAQADNRPASKVSIADAGGRYTGTEAESALQEIAGAGRTTETVKANADAIATKVPTSRQILAGVGLSGGGDLTADRTLSVAIQILHVQDQKASGTAGGTFTSGAWQTRTLNTVVTNTISGASLAGNQITLPAGTYDIEARAVANKVNFHKAKFCTVAPADILIGTSEVAASGDDTVTSSRVNGRFVLATETVLELRHRCSMTCNTTGFGNPSNMGVIEIYADVLIRKIA